MRLSEFDHQRVGILGMGREGQSVYRLLSSQACPTALLLFDDAQDANSGAMPLAQAAAQKLDIAIKSPGIPPHHASVSALTKQGVAITSASNIFFAHNSDRASVVITGTKGKSTTAALLHHVLTGAKRQSVLAGNIGRPLTDLLMDQEPGSLLIAELSSYQLADFTGTPDLAVVLNLHQEHLDWHGSVQRYHHDKMAWMTSQSKTQVLLNADDPALLAWADQISQCDFFNRGLLRAIPGKGIALASQRLLVSESQLPLRGAHNLLNTCAVMAAAARFGVPPEHCAELLAGFQGLPHRLHELGLRDGVLWVDDSISTTPQSSLAALASYPDRQTVLILGGQDRGLDWGDFVDQVSVMQNLCVVLMPDTGARLYALLCESVSCRQVADLEQAVELAAEVAAEGAVILLSPGAPSYGAFENFAARGHSFARLAGF